MGSGGSPQLWGVRTTVVVVCAGEEAAAPPTCMPPPAPPLWFSRVVWNPLVTTNVSNRDAAARTCIASASVSGGRHV